MEIKFFVEGEAQIVRKLEGLGKDLRDFSPEFKESVNFLKNFYQGEVFNTRGGAIGEPWKPRKQPTGSWPLLEKTGRMRNSFETAAEKLFGSVSNATDYFKYHQSRMPRRSNLPRRIMMLITNNLKNQIVQIFHKGIWNRTKK